MRGTSWRGSLDERLPHGQVARVPAQNPAQLLGGEPAAVLAPGTLLGTLDEGEPKTAVQLRLARGCRLGVSAHVRHVTRTGHRSAPPGGSRPVTRALPSKAVEQVIDRLHPDPANPRRIGDAELDARPTR